MNFEELKMKYQAAFGEFPPQLVTLDENDELYLRMLKEAIDNGEPLTRNDLAEVFMTDQEAVY